jgi:hypothetical protein
VDITGSDLASQLAHFGVQVFAKPMQ